MAHNGATLPSYKRSASNKEAREGASDIAFGPMLARVSVVKHGTTTLSSLERAMAHVGGCEAIVASTNADLLGLVIGGLFGAAITCG